ncbi:ABC transporter permease [Mumia sp. zg.B21]|uniref:ABC transporter permease n=1 Tax=Mumia sp. zg.B21 TaxID=2855447 RepID=UPI001C6E34E7|nr:ABC transporter permease [Mumia sp. zg.B21]MBW9210205.1 ABC transporter permease [Mumia sp. zg.B21]
MSTATTPRASLVLDSQVMVRRSLVTTLRNPEAFSTALALPVALMLLFVYVFGGALSTDGAYVDYVVPGIILLCAGFGAGTTAAAVAHDMTNGIIDRFRSMPIAAGSVIVGHVVASVARNAVATTLVIGVALLVGWRPSGGPVAWLAAIGALTVFVLAISWLAATVGLIARTPESANAFTMVLAFLPYVSTAFVPADTLPPALRGFAENQPMTPMIETLRGLWMGTPIGDHGWWALGWCGVILVGAAVCSARLFRRRTA